MNTYGPYTRHELAIAFLCDLHRHDIFLVRDDRYPSHVFRAEFDAAATRDAAEGDEQHRAEVLLKRRWAMEEHRGLRRTHARIRIAAGWLWVTPTPWLKTRLSRLVCLAPELFELLQGRDERALKLRHFRAACDRGEVTF